jgi:hypothetical protein
MLVPMARQRPTLRPINPMKFCKTLILSLSLGVPTLAAVPALAQGENPAVTAPSTATTATQPAVDANADMKRMIEALIGTAVSLSNQDYPEIEQAIVRFRNNDAEGTLDFLKKAKEKYPKLPPVYVILAKLQVMAQNTQGAYNLLELQVAEDPIDPEAYLLLAEHYSRRRLRSSKSTPATKNANATCRFVCSPAKRPFTNGVLSGIRRLPYLRNGSASIPTMPCHTPD